ncbi:MAG: radical SAM protein, partial [Prevotella sp.]
SNSTFITKPAIREALMRVDNNILKLDTVNADYIRRVDRPTQPSYNVESIIENMKLFEGHIIVQTMFMRGTTDEGLDVDNTSEEFVAPWLEAIKDIRPQEVMIYTIDRETPDSHLLKATHEELDAIKARVETLGIPCTASY